MGVLNKRTIKCWKEKLPHARPIEGEYDGCKDLNQMATEVGWEPARERLCELLEQGVLSLNMKQTSNEKAAQGLLVAYIISMSVNGPKQEELGE